MQRRRSLRYSGYDYSEPGAYFITMCVQDRRCLFGHVASGEVAPSEVGDMVRATLLELPGHLSSVAIDTFVVMPNHVHALVFLGVEVQAAPSLGMVVRRFKTLTTSRYIDGVRHLAWEPFAGRLWQRNFHDHIVRSDRGIERIRKYIEGNPGRWQARLDGRLRNPS